MGSSPASLKCRARAPDHAPDARRAARGAGRRREGPPRRVGRQRRPPDSPPRQPADAALDQPAASTLGRQIQLRGRTGTRQPATTGAASLRSPPPARAPPGSSTGSGRARCTGRCSRASPACSAGPPGSPTVQFEAASAARGTVIARISGMATSPARTIRRRDRSTSGIDASGATSSSPASCQLPERAVHQRRRPAPPSSAIVSASRSPSIDRHTRAAGAFRQNARCVSST